MSQLDGLLIELPDVESGGVEGKQYISESTASVWERRFTDWLWIKMFGF
jgi:hypothetical protein